MEWIRRCWMSNRKLVEATVHQRSLTSQDEEEQQLQQQSGDQKGGGSLRIETPAYHEVALLTTSTTGPTFVSKSPDFWSLKLVGGSGKGNNAAASAAGSAAAMSVLSPRRRRTQERGKMVKRMVYLVTSPAPYVVLVLLGLMVVMIFIDVMPISGLICVFAILMVVTVVVGNHWRNKETWVEVEVEVEVEEGDGGSSNGGGIGGERKYRYDTAATAAAGLHSAQEEVEEEEAEEGAEDENEDEEMDAAAVRGEKGGAAEPDVEGGKAGRHRKMKVGGRKVKPVSNNRSATKSSAATGALTQSNSVVHSQLHRRSEAAEDLGPPTAEDKLDNLNHFFEALFGSIDYSLLIIFLGLFVVVENVASTGLPKQIWGLIVGKAPFQTASSIIGISLFVLFTSQCLGNVAVIQLAKPNVASLNDEHKRLAWAVISFVATVGGNLTITGSAGIQISLFVLFLTWYVIMYNLKIQLYIKQRTSL
jgi:hypothetical protein